MGHEPRGPEHWIALLRWPVVVVLLALGGLLLAQETCRTAREAAEAPGGAVREAGRAVEGIAERFRSGRITTTFTAAIPQLQPGGPRLELASYDATELISRTDERAVLFDLVPLGRTVSEIRVPVTYRYHVRLDEPWQLEVRDGTCLVDAPPLRPTLPPAIHTQGMEKRSERGWLRFDSAERMAELERSLTPTLTARAEDADHLELVRETARRRVAEFVQSWLLRENHWGPGRFTAIRVVFRNEPSPPGAPPSPPTLQWEAPAPAAQ